MLEGLFREHKGANSLGGSLLIKFKELGSRYYRLLTTILNVQIRTDNKIRIIKSRIIKFRI